MALLLPWAGVTSVSIRLKGIIWYRNMIYGAMFFYPGIGSEFGIVLVAALGYLPVAIFN